MYLSTIRKEALGLICLICFICLLISNQLIAAPGTSWFCTANDVDKKIWSAHHVYQKPAVALALDACKKQSRLPTSCKLRESDCELSVNGVSTRAIWQCEALDETAKSFSGKLHPDKDTAALSAKASCKENSSVPETCYIHPFTCVNLQEQK